MKYQKQRCSKNQVNISGKYSEPCQTPKTKLFASISIYTLHGMSNSDEERSYENEGFNHD